MNFRNFLIYLINKMKYSCRRISLTLILIPGMLLLSSWGFQGHKKINEPAAPALPAQMDFLKPSWTVYLPAHGSDADYRKQQDPSEAPRHYIDIDNYPVFIQNGKIPMTWDSIVSAYGYDFVIEQGILPWATLAAFDSVRECFRRHNWDRAAMFAADLGHYVGDGHMPLHITRNYDGQFTGQPGVHSRYETKMLNAFHGQISYALNEAVTVPEVRSYIFTYIYSNYRYADSVLLADRRAMDSTGSSTSQAYLAAFWENSGTFTTQLLRNASQCLTNLIYTAWMEAGSPIPQGITGEPFASVMKEIFPNPGVDSITIPFEIKKPDIAVTLNILDNEGKIISTLIENQKYSVGQNEITWNCRGITPGQYYALLSSEGQFSVRKIIVIR